MILTIRIKPALKDWLRDRAKKNHRSMSQELVMLIEREKEKTDR